MRPNEFSPAFEAAKLNFLIFSIGFTILFLLFWRLFGQKKTEYKITTF